MTEPIIGVDLGNFFLQPCFIQNIDTKTKRGGVFYDLVDPALNTPYGIPTAFFYSQKRGILLGGQAVRATPTKNCIRYLKRDLFKNGKPNSVTLDGKTFTYDEMIIAVAQYAIRIAAKQLENTLNIKTNKVSLAYPASMSAFVKNHLVSLMEQITLDDGRKIEIVGTIAEPAAAALDYLACSNSTKDETALVADLGAGTFDVSIVRVYPKGKKRIDNSTYYYDVKFTDGLEDLGGKEFDEIIRNINCKNAGKDASDPMISEMIRNSAESLKRDLSFDQVVYPMIMLKNGVSIKEITRTEFENEARPLMERILKMVEDTINTNLDITIDHLILTGGASQMPMVERMFKERFPALANKIQFHMPSKAIASGTARFGVKEDGGKQVTSDKKSKEARTVELRTIRDIGSDFYKDSDDKTGFIVTYVKAGTPIPYTSPWVDSFKLSSSRYTRFGIYEAKNSSPDEQKIASDYQLVHFHKHDHGQERPIGYRAQSRIVIDERHLSYLEIREPDNPSKAPVRYPFTVDFK